MKSLLLGILSLCLPFANHAQDTLTIWGGSKKAVYITRIGNDVLFYKKKEASDKEHYIEKKRLMNIQAYDTSMHWEERIYDQRLYGELSTDSLAIDQLAQEHVSVYYHGDQVVGKMTLLTTLVGTPIAGLGYAVARSVSRVPENKLGLLGNPHAQNPDYVKSYAKYAKRKNQKRAWKGFVAGSMVYAVPIGIVMIAVQNMSFDLRLAE